MRVLARRGWVLEVCMAVFEQSHSGPNDDVSEEQAPAAKSGGAPSTQPSPDLKADAVKSMRLRLQESGYRIDYDPEYDRRYKLDFIITRIRDIHAYVNLGVQLSIRSDDLELQEKFLDGARRGVVHKSVLIEVDEHTVHTGAIPVATSACMAFLFDRRYSNFKCIGLRVFEDCTFHFFDIEENVRRLRRHAQDDSSRLGQEMSGNIIAYFTDKGFGFIESSSDQKFFFHIANVVDDELRVQLPSYIPGDVLPVIFKYGGSDGKKYPKAIEVEMDGQEYDEYDDDDDDDDGY